MTAWLSCRWWEECHASTELWDLKFWDLLSPGPKSHHLKDREDMAWRGHPLCHWRELHRSVALDAACIRAVCFVSLGWEIPPWKDSDGMEWTPGTQQSHWLLMFPHACRTWCARPGETAFSAGAVSPQEVTVPGASCRRWHLTLLLKGKQGVHDDMWAKPSQQKEECGQHGWLTCLLPRCAPRPPAPRAHTVWWLEWAVGGVGPPGQSWP